MVKTTPFQYTTRLGPDEIRLLSLIPSPSPSPSPSSPLSFHLQTTTLPSPKALPTTKYTALSHVWGSAAAHPLPTILINAHPFTIPPNLHTTLTHLSQAELRTTPFWIDALCINQADPIEKHAQIARMADIYRGAERVLAFLGEGTARTDRVLRQMERIGGEMLDAGAMMLCKKDLQAWKGGFEGCEAREEKLLVRERIEGMILRERGGLVPVFGATPGLNVDAVEELLRRPWFGRAWVVQEVCAAGDWEGAVVFAVGGRRISWERFWAARLFSSVWLVGEAEKLLDGTWKTFLLGLLVMFRRTRMALGRSGAPASDILGMRRAYLRGDLDRRLRMWLVRLYVADTTNPLQCREPEDKLGALRGLASDGHVLDRILVPGEAWQTVYARLALHFYSEGDLDFLSLCRYRSLSSTLPSWATDWTQQQRRPWLGYKSGDDAQLFDAGKGTQARVYRNESDDKTLCLRGFTVDTVSEVGSEWTSNPDDKRFNWQSARLRIDEIDRFLSLSKFYSPAEKVAARWRIVVADRVINDLGGQQVRATTSSVAEESFAKLQPIVQAISPPGVQPPLRSWQFCYWEDLISLWSSRPFLSSKGYIGLCPGQTETGDTVFIPSGGHCPYVIRRTQAEVEIKGEAWNLVGEAYVHGIMDGELDLGNKDAEATKFKLV